MRSRALTSGSVNVELRLEVHATGRPNVGSVGLLRMVAIEILVVFFLGGSLIIFYDFPIIHYFLTPKYEL